MIKLIIAGGRDFNDYDLLIDSVNELIEKGILIEGSITIVSGMARGADTLAVQLSLDNDLPLLKFPADWNLHGKAAGFIRNQQMAKEADMLLAFWDGKSKGTRHMIEYMEGLSKPAYVINYRGFYDTLFHC